MVSVSPALVVPSGWTRVDTGSEGQWQAVTAYYAEPLLGEKTEEGFRANLNVTVADNEGQTFGEWQRTTERVLPELLDDYLAIDAERVGIAGREGGRRLGHHRGPHGEALTMEQWFVAVDGVGHTLTFTVPTRRYGALADLIEDCAATWTPGGEGS